MSRLVCCAAAEFGLLGLVLNFMYAFLFILFTFLLLRLVCECFLFFFTALVVLCTLLFLFRIWYSVFGIYLISLLLSPLFTWLGPNK